VPFPPYKQKIYLTIYSITNVGNTLFIATGTEVYKSTDGGTTWVPKNNGLPFSVSSLITTGNILIAGTLTGIYFSSDIGENWNDFTADLPTLISINAITVDNQFITVGTSENVWHRSISNITGVSEKTNNILPTAYNLSQNYPNPSTTINFQIPSANKVSLKVYDVLGREVKFLVNEFKIAGKYSVTFNATNLASGVYFYNLRAGNYVESKKMILLK
jgi:hypothetical protein